MAAALLQDNDKCNKLEDNRESCLHDYEDEDGVKGGDLKRGFLVTCEIPCVIKFDHRPLLDKLIEELTEVFAARYKDPPSAVDINAVEEARAANLPASIMSRLTTFKYQKCFNDLITLGWLVDTLHCYLNADPWPPSDKARGQPIGTGSSNKRAREQTKLESQRLRDGSGL